MPARPRSVSQPPLGFRVWEVSHPLGMADSHSHVDLEINCVTAGRVDYRHGGSVVSVRRGQIGIFWGGVPHRLIESATATRGIWLTVPVEWLLRWALPGDFTPRLLGGHFMVIELEMAWFRSWVGDFSSGDPTLLRAVSLEVEALLHRAAAAPERKEPLRDPGAAGPRRFARVADFLARHYAEPLDLALIAAAAGVHPKYLARVFRAQCGLTVWEYLTRLRIAHAQRLLLTTDLKVIDVAYESGFASVASFYEAFARYGQGGRPAAFRRDRAGISP